MNEETRNLPIEPDLEARIVALVLGEASDFEAGELDRLIKSRPELAAFKREMEQVSQLAHEVSQHEERPDAQWQLSSERRQVVLDVIDGKVATTTIRAAIGTGEKLVSKPARFRSRRWMQVLEVAVATAILVVLIGLMLPGVQMREAALRLSKDKTFYSPRSWDSEPASSASPRPSVDLYSTESMTSDFKELEPSGSGFIGNCSPEDSLAALSAIQNSLQQSAGTSSVESGGKLFSTPPTSGSAVAVTPKINPPQNLSAVLDVGGIDLPNEPLITEMITSSSNSTTDSPTLQNPDYGRSSGIDPVQADKLIAGVQTQPGVSPGGTAAAPQAAVPDGGTVLLGGIKRSAEGTSLGLPVLDSIENQTFFGDRELAEVEAEVDSIVPGYENQPAITSGSLLSPQLSPHPGDVKGKEQQGVQGLAENGTVDGFDVQIPDSTKADNDLQYRYSTNGRDVPGGMGDAGGIGGGGMGGGDRMGGGLGSKETSSLGTEAGGGMPSGGKQDDAEFELAQSALAEPGSPSDGESIEQQIDAKNELGKESKSGEAEKKLADRGGEVTAITQEPRMDDIIDKVKDGRGEEYRKQQSAEDSLRRLSDRQREFESELTRGGQTDQNDRATKLNEQMNGFSNYGVYQRKDRSVPSNEQSVKDSKDASGGIAAQHEMPQRRSGEILDLAKKPISKREAPSAGLNETNAATEGFSTFSLHVSDVSFKLAGAALARGEWPEAAKIRIEEFVNAFDYGDPLPCTNEKVACVVEQAIHPFLQQRNVLRVSMRTSAEGRAASTPLRLTLVLDNSGSMERVDRQQAVQRALSLLAQQLSPNDQVTLISFARQPRLLAENVSGSELGKLVELIGQLPSEGGTNIEAALKLAFEKAASQQTADVQNRIVLLTDGAVNLGNANPESLSRMVETMRTAGIAFDAAGISADGLNDEVLEALTRKGDGRYYLLDGEESSGGRFAQQIAGALRPSASNVKVQIEFNPKRVGQYKLLGFEKHILEKEDFRNDAVDAAELAAAEAGVALYQFEAKADGEGDVGTVSVRFRDLATGQMVEQRWPIPYEANALRPDQAANSIRLATAAAMLAARLRGEALGEAVDLKSLSDLMAGLSEQQQYDPRVQQLKLMIEQARQLSEK